jgi:hypothetical protein
MAMATDSGLTRQDRIRKLTKIFFMEIV